MADVDIERLARADINLLVALEALMQEKSVTRAARRLSVSQSAMSHTLNRLRDWFDDELFVRSGQSMSPTPLAIRMREPVQTALRELNRVLEGLQPFAAEHVRTSFRIAAFDFAQLTLMPPAISALATQAPGIQLLVLPYPVDAKRSLADGEVDLVIGLLREPHGKAQRVLTTERFVSVVRRGHPCLEQELTLERFASLSHAVVSPVGRPRGFMDTALSEHGHERHVGFVAPQLFTAALAVCQSDMILTGAERPLRILMDALPLEIVTPPIELAPFQVAMTWHERRTDDPTHRFVRDTIASLHD